MNTEQTSKNIFTYKTNNIEKVEIFHVLHNEVALLMRRRYMSGEQEMATENFLESKVWTIYI